MITSRQLKEGGRATRLLHVSEEEDAKKRKKNQKKNQENKKKKKKKKNKKKNKKAKPPQNLFGWHNHPFPQKWEDEKEESHQRREAPQ